MIRRATMDDIPALIALARMEHAISRFSDQPFDLSVVEQRLLAAIHGLATVVFVSENDSSIDGLIVGMVQPNLFNRYTTAYELMWFSSGGEGMKLLGALTDWANRMRATSLVVHNYAGAKSSEAFTRVMTRKGFDVLGMTYSLELEN